MPRGQTTAIGDLRDRVVLQTPEGTSGEGYETQDDNVPANIRSAGGSELLKFGAQVAVNATVITLRYRTDIRPDWRIADAIDGKTYQITSYGDETGRRQWLTVYATELL